MKTLKSIITLKSPSIIGISIFASLAYYGLMDKHTEVPHVDTAMAKSRQIQSLAVDSINDLSTKEVQSILETRLRGESKKMAATLATHISKLSMQYRISPSIILSVISAESSFRTDARSYVGAMGLMQVRPTTAQYISDKYRLRTYRRAKDLNNPFINVTVGVAYLHYLRNRFSNSIHYVAAYNMGPTALAGKLSNNTFDLGKAKLEKYVGEIHDEAHQLRRKARAYVVASY
jgi:soluble lytic murein transglycosylase-like protein